MHVSKKTFDTPQYLRRSESGETPVEQERIIESRRKLALGLNHFLDSVSMSNRVPPLMSDLTRYGITDGEKFLDGVTEYVRLMHKELLDCKIPSENIEALKVNNPQLSDAELEQRKAISAGHDSDYHTALASFREKLISIRNDLEQGVYTKVRVREHPTAVPSSDISEAVTQAVRVLDGQISILDYKIQSTETYAEVRAKERERIEQELNPNSDASAIISNVRNGAADDADKKWSIKKTLGVIALSVAGVGLLALAVYLYESHRYARRQARQRLAFLPQTQQPFYPQVSQTNGYGGYNTAGLGPPNLATLGYVPGIPVPGANLAQPAAAFNPNPIYGYPT